MQAFPVPFTNPDCAGSGAQRRVDAARRCCRRWPTGWASASPESSSMAQVTSPCGRAWEVPAAPSLIRVRRATAPTAPGPPAARWTASGRSAADASRWRAPCALSPPLASMIRPRRSRWRTPTRGLSTSAVTVVFRASARTSACRTRTNCRIWGSSPLTIAIRADPQPSEATGSRRPQVMEQPSGPSRRAFMLSWPPVRSSISL